MYSSLAKKNPRIESIDLLRGIIMVIMALDHSRDFFHTEGLSGNPLDPASSYPILYFTRWVTHFCAPGFVFLSGLSAWLQLRQRPAKELGLFLIKRGCWLILLDLTVMSFIFTFDIHAGFFLLETLWSIGAGFVVLGLMIRLPFRFILFTGLVIVFCHNFLDFAERTRSGELPAWWQLMHRPGIIHLWGNHQLFVFYPFLPWVGLTLMGYCCGYLFTEITPIQRKKILLRFGIAAIALFILLRAANIYGDPTPWSHQKNAMATFFSFMNVQKYPPSLLFMCATIGPILLFLAVAIKTNGRLADILKIYGRVPLFYFVLHFFILHVVQAVTYLWRGHSIAEGMKGLPGLPFKFAQPGEGFNLGMVYVIWIFVVIIMFPLCRWFDQYKKLNRERWWLSYL